MYRQIAAAIREVNREHIIAQQASVRNRSAAKEEEHWIFRRFSAMFEQFEPRYWYWELIELARKLVLNGFVVLCNQGTILQLTIALVVVIVVEEFVCANLASRELHVKKILYGLCDVLPKEMALQAPVVANEALML